ncbi:LIM domain and RING finger protein -like protein [Emericellopsis cladophorae]|uniref:RING-type E3 ubiquitin transferase n=1 Tax=Emericellopsis cladophorae TaxID=2686198 RepID=A0A9P9Y334_9HYPO|nr:LIM domain and RING finger protein -like protein [Emericellopsis cladophorae]KAI6782619.1 LIM domain and RING finger protein -like protein [Emericellopsis cladophorae]
MGLRTHLQARSKAEEAVAEVDGQEGEEEEEEVVRIALAAVARPKVAIQEDNVPEDAELCFICANVVSHHSIAPCNHTTCHICGLRMRALYKDKNCAHCRTPAPFVIFAQDATKRFEEFTDSDMSTVDENIGIKYANEDIVGDTVLLLRYNCPEPDCDFAGLGWPDLHRHVRSAHRKRMCDLCTRNKRVFTHEHELFADKELEKHMRRGDDKPGSADQTGFKGHPLCGFCGERFYDDDKLYEHCRMKHERCFLCDRRDARHPHYYQDYSALESHFKKDHYLCADRECQEKKFVVFDTEMDLQAHQLEEHGGKASGREARTVDISGFDIRSSFQPERRGGREGGRERGRGREGRGRGRDQNADVAPATTPQALRRDEIAFQRQMAIHSAQSVSNRTFGGQLSAGGPASSTTPSGSRGNSQSTTPRPQATNIDPMDTHTPIDPANMTSADRARLVRHGAVIERAANLLGNDAQKMTTFRDSVSSYRKNKLTAPQLVDAFFGLFADTASSALGTLVKEVADLFEDSGKSSALKAAWQDWRAINEDYPSLPGLTQKQHAPRRSFTSAGRLPTRMDSSPQLLKNGCFVVVVVVGIPLPPISWAVQSECLHFMDHSRQCIISASSTSSPYIHDLAASTSDPSCQWRGQLPGVASRAEADDEYLGVRHWTRHTTRHTGRNRVLVVRWEWLSVTGH